MQKSILVIEDDRRMREIIGDYLEEDFNVILAEDGLEGIKKFEAYDVDLVILDIMMPNLDGWSVCRRIREQSNTLIVILSALVEEDNKLMGFELGADEYVSKPFSPKVLVARVKALLNRFEDNGAVMKQCEEEAHVIHSGNLMLNKQARTIRLDEEEIVFSLKEYEILLMMLENQDIVLRRDDIINKIWGYDYFGDGRVVDTNIKNIRKKLVGHAEHIQTVIGVGYKYSVKR